MLRPFLFALPFAALAASGAEAETVFVGDSLVLSTTTTCGTSIAAGETARLTYRPAGAKLGNGGDSYLAYVANRSSFTMTIAGAVFGSGQNYAGQNVSSYLGVATIVGGVVGWQQSPAKIGPDTETIELTATLANYLTIKGCTVTIRSNLIQVK
ncbi:hypothetical protein [Chenggangzhangella methanolivorans]|uniref:Uncharacterized protein n=1 Tax=Chenggangzhangella methanolivorans TaxID=1437009 RepID=A0A9E6R6R7_9HYPH|nr:hypothetical protein [Chenggangzhangella methanolivorans]QZN98334.1 hypothetical protein K6K41_14505 [Chenggangzhangella methanolivorans]